MRKVASPARSLSQFSKLIAKNGIKNSSSVARKKMINDSGTGSMFLDLLGGRKLKNSKTLAKMQESLTDLDMKGGGVAYDFLGRRKSDRLNKMKNMFVNEHTIDKGVNAVGGTDAVKLKTTGLLNPLTKTKNKVFPFVGGMTVAGHVLPGVDNNTPVGKEVSGYGEMQE